MKTPVIHAPLPPMMVLALFAFIGCGPPTETLIAPSVAPVPAPVQEPAPAHESETAEQLPPSIKPALPEKIVLDGTAMKYASGGWELEPKSLKAIHQAVEKTRSFGQGFTVVVTGYASSSGTRARSLVASRRRARFVAKVLVRAGIPAGKITVRGAGPDKPIADNATREGRLKNQRVEIEFLEP